MSGRERWIVALWLAAGVGCGAWLATRLVITTDLTAFLPQAATHTQALLVQQLRDGPASRSMLIGMEGTDTAALARASRDLAGRLDRAGLFVAVANGDPRRFEADRAVVMRSRYLLSPGVTAERFAATGLRRALEEDLELLASPLGALVKRTLQEDPTGELRLLVAPMTSGRGPRVIDNVWFSGDGSRALLVAQTRAPGFDIDAQQRAVTAVRDAFAQVAPPEARLLLTGAGAFAAASRETIARDAERVSLVTALGVVVCLFAVYRAWRPVALSALPVVTGLLVGLAAVGFWFGTVHAITLAFGAILIGEAVDYPTYLFASAARGENLRVTRERVGPTLRLAFLTTACSAMAMLLSNFEGLAQLGLLTMGGILAAGLTTQYVLPALAPAAGFTGKVDRLPFDGDRVLGAVRRFRGVFWLLFAASLAVLAVHRDALWDDDLASLSPVPAAAKALDRELRKEAGAPDIRYLVLVSAADREAALARSERVATVLQAAIDAGWIGGFDLAARWLPSRTLQQARRAALPPAGELEARLRVATAGLSFREGVFAPFLVAVEGARTGPLLDRGQFQGTALGERIDSLLYRTGDEWVALVPLAGVADAGALGAALAQPGEPGVHFLDLKREADQLVAGYRAQSLRMIALGLVCIGALVYAGTRDATRTLRALLPVAVAVVVTIALLLLAGQRLTIFHLAGLLLVVGVGLNYSLFFNQGSRSGGDDALTLLALVVACATTLLAALALAATSTPILGAIGMTVAAGTAAAFAGSAALSRRAA